MEKVKEFLEKLGERLPAKYKNIIADAGYESEENCVYLENQSLDIRQYKKL